MSLLKKAISNSVEVKKSLILIEKEIKLAINIILKKIKNGGKIFLCGNGGSAADAQHLAAEFLVRLRPHINRYPIPALSLATDTSTITACSNDYSFTKIFSRNLQALASSKDILIALTTSGNSLNILEALKVAKQKRIFTIGFLGNKGGKAKKLCNIKLIVKSNITSRIQESHILLGHIICQLVEESYFNTLG